MSALNQHPWNAINWASVPPIAKYYWLTERGATLGMEAARQPSGHQTDLKAD